MWGVPMLKYASISKIGNRKCNEDYIKISSVSERYCFVVCDGLGGHECGDVAAQIAGNTIVEEFYYCNNLSDFLENAFMKAHNNILSQQKARNIKGEMKTTVVGMVTDGKYGYVGHIGDSRFYGFSDGNNYICTFDHSVPQILVESNVIDEKQIRNHPSRNMLLKVLGDKNEDTQCELSEPVLLQEYNAFLLCTDGFWEMITEEEMMSTLFNSSSPTEWLDRMIAIVEVNGLDKKMDNYSAIAVFNE